MYFTRRKMAIPEKMWQGMKDKRETFIEKVRAGEISIDKLSLTEKAKEMTRAMCAAQ